MQFTGYILLNFAICGDLVSTYKRWWLSQQKVHLSVAYSTVVIHYIGVYTKVT